MRINITRYTGTEYAHISSAPRFVVPPSVVIHLLKGAADHGGSVTPVALAFGQENGDGAIGASSASHDFGIPTDFCEQEIPEVALWWGVLRQAIDDLYLLERDFIHDKEIPTIVDAFNFFNEPGRAYSDPLAAVGEIIGLDPSYIRRKLRELGYLGYGLRVRKMSPRRTARFGLANLVNTLRKKTDSKPRRNSSGARLALEFLNDASTTR